MKKTFLSLTVILVTLASCSSEDDTAPYVELPSTGAVLQPEVGGPNQPKQSFIDFSTSQTAAVRRDSWDFGFSTGSEFRVIINGSVKMAVKQLATSDITLTQTEDSSVSVGAGDNLATNGYCDNPTGILAGAGAGIGTAIAEISATDADNKVYLVNLGLAVSTTVPAIGAVSVDGAARGWKKVRILRSGTGYKIQYADLASSTFQERIITKDAAYNFTYFSVATGSTVTVEPPKEKWDLKFTTFTNYFIMGTSGEVTYGFSDFIVTNRMGGTKVYQVLITPTVNYDGFTRANVEETSFTLSTTDQRVIGATWRNGGGPGSLPSIRTDRFYVVKDAAGNYYKLKFRALTNELGERGNPTIEYAILN